MILSSHILRCLQPYVYGGVHVGCSNREELFESDNFQLFGSQWRRGRILDKDGAAMCADEGVTEVWRAAAPCRLVLLPQDDDRPTFEDKVAGPRGANRLIRHEMRQGQILAEDGTHLGRREHIFWVL